MRLKHKHYTMGLKSKSMWKPTIAVNFRMSASLGPAAAAGAAALLGNIFYRLNFGKHSFIPTNTVDIYLLNLVETFIHINI